MRDIERDPPHGQTHPTAHDEADRAESREETVDRVTSESRESQIKATHGSSAATDPSTGRRLGRAMRRRGVLGFAIGAVIGVGLALLIWAFTPGDIGGGLVGLIIFMALAVGIAGTMVAAFLALEREDGRIEREVEQDVGEDSPAPARPLDERHDS